MNWDAIGAIGQIVGSIAVIVTLGYLAAQVRHTRAEVRRSIRQSRAETVRELNLHRMSNERLTAVYDKANAAFGTPLPPFFTKLMEQASLTSGEVGLLYDEQWNWWQYRSQVISYVDELFPGERSEFDWGTRYAYGTNPWGCLWYDTVKSTLNPDAVRYVDNLLARPA